jgi:hypothetical protein
VTLLHSSGFNCSGFSKKSIYMLDVISDPTAEETSSGTGGTVHRLQIKQNKDIYAIFGIGPED